jgi:hypothetical protein
VAAARHDTLVPMLRLYGCPVTEEDGRWLVDRLQQDGRASAVTAAAIIEKGLDRELYAVALTPDERTAILGVLVGMPDGLTG